MTDIAVRADKVSKTYKLSDSPSDRWKEILLRRPRARHFRALSDVSFGLDRCAALGPTGANGAGKSTLLNIIAGTTQPSSSTASPDGASAPIAAPGMRL